MENLRGVLYGEAKKVIETTGKKPFYATAIKTLKCDFANLILILYANFKLLYDQPQLKRTSRISHISGCFMLL